MRALPEPTGPRFVNIEAEMATLGSALLSEQAIDTVRCVLNSRDFYLPAHREMWRAVLFLHKHRTSVDLVTLRDRLLKTGKLVEIGGIEYAIKVAESVPSAANAEHYAGIVQSLAVQRRLDEALAAASGKVMADPDSTYEQQYDAIMGLLGKAMTSKGGSAFTPLHVLQDALIEKLSMMLDGKLERTGVMTGLTDYDRFLTGLYPGDLYIIAARPSIGKTSLAMSMAIEIARRGGVSAIFSIEMGKDRLNERILAYEARINLYELRNADLTDATFQRMLDANERIRNLELHIDDSGDVGVAYIRAKSRRLQSEKGKLSAVFVDYLQLMRGSRRFENRTAEVTEITRGLKQLAKELQVPVVAMSQLSREVEKRRNKRPILADLRESGSIEQDADVVTFLYREEYYKRGKRDAQQLDLDAGVPEIAELIVAKNRNGPTGTCLLGFIPSNTRFCLADQASKDAYRENRKI